MKKLKGAEAKELLAQNQGTIFLEFSTTGCGDCKMMEPFIAEVEAQFVSTDVQFIEVDAEEAKTFRTDDKGDVLKVPSFFVIKKDQVEHIGYEFQPVAKLVSAIKNNL